MPYSEAKPAIQRHAQMTLEQLVELPLSLSPLTTYAATGGSPVAPAELQSLRGQVRSLAVEAGFPERQDDAAFRTFDRACGLLLHRSMGIVTADAAHDEVWMAMTCAVLPEITPWRFPAPPEERYTKRLRSTLGRLWWRVETLGDDHTEWGDLGEDILVQIMERPTLSGDRRTARALCRASVASRGTTSITGPDLLRDAIKRVLRLAAVVSPQALSDTALEELISDCFRRAIDNLEHPIHEPV